MDLKETELLGWFKRGDSIAAYETVCLIEFLYCPLLYLLSF